MLFNMKNSPSLLDATLQLMRSSQQPVKSICDAIEVTPRWYQKLLSGEIQDPSVRRIQRLHDYLAAQDQPPEEAA